ncbi:hypothetical protein CEXT_465611, partial [Caerostris extrusa]
KGSFIFILVNCSAVSTLLTFSSLKVRTGWELPWLDKGRVSEPNQCGPGPVVFKTSLILTCRKKQTN